MWIRPKGSREPADGIRYPTEVKFNEDMWTSDGGSTEVNGEAILYRLDPDPVFEAIGHSW